MHTLYPSSTERMSGATCPYTELLVVSGSNTSSNSNSTVTSPPPIPGSFRTICDQHHQAMTSWSYKQARNRQAREPVQLSLCWIVESGEPAGADHTRHARGCGRTTACGSEFAKMCICFPTHARPRCSSWSGRLVMMQTQHPALGTHCTFPGERRRLNAFRPTPVRCSSWPGHLCIPRDLLI